MAFWLYIDSKDRKAVWYLRRGVELARQGKAATEGRQVRNKQSSLPPLPLQNYVTKQKEEKTDLISKGTPKENKRKEGRKNAQSYSLCNRRLHCTSGFHAQLPFCGFLF
jgi:hypothetical protein